MQYKELQLVLWRKHAGINLFIGQVSNKQRRGREKKEEGDRECGVSKRMACMTAGREKQ